MNEAEKFKKRVTEIVNAYSHDCNSIYFGNSLRVITALEKLVNKSTDNESSNKDKTDYDIGNNEYQE